MTKTARTRLPTDQRREQLLRLGLELFSTRSHDSVSIDEIAEAAGISRGLLYHYFPSKRHFFVAVLRTAVDELRELISTDAELPPEEAVTTSLHAWFDYVTRRRQGLFTVLQGGMALDAEVRDIVEGMRGQVVEEVLAGLDVREPSPLLVVALRGWVGSLEGLALAWLAHGQDVAADDLVRVATATLWTTVESATA